MNDANKQVPQESSDLYDKLLELVPEVQRKGKNNPYTSHNGNMFTFVSKEGELGLRIGKVERELFAREYDTGPMISYGAVMREYVRVPLDLFRRTAEVAKYMKLSWAYAQTLEPKPTKKK